MDIVVTGRHIDVPARLRAYAEEKLVKVEKLCPKAIRVYVEIARERNPRMSEISERVELTCVSRGPVIRAEAAAADMVAAFDLAWSKLESRLRRVADRRRVHRGARTPLSVAAATAGTAAQTPADVRSAGDVESAGDVGSAVAAGAVDHHLGAEFAESGEGPMLVREKLHLTAPMTLDQALYEMELVGHDFYLFADKESGLPSVVYRRRGYDYGVIRIDPQAADQAASGEPLR